VGVWVAMVGGVCRRFVESVFTLILDVFGLDGLLR